MLDYNKICNNLYVGSFLHPGRADWLKQRINFTAVLNLQTNTDLKNKHVNLPILERYYKLTGIVFRRVPIIDFDLNDLQSKLDECVEELRKLLDDNHIVYLHCNSGVNRAPTVAIAYLRKHQNYTLPDAIEYVQNLRPCSPYVSSMKSGDFNYICHHCGTEQNEKICKKCGDNLDPPFSFRLLDDVTLENRYKWIEEEQSAWIKEFGDDVDVDDDEEIDEDFIFVQ